MEVCALSFSFIPFFSSAWKSLSFCSTALDCGQNRLNILAFMFEILNYVGQSLDWLIKSLKTFWAYIWQPGLLLNWSLNCRSAWLCIFYNLSALTPRRIISLLKHKESVQTWSLEASFESTNELNIL